MNIVKLVAVLFGILTCTAVHPQALHYPFTIPPLAVSPVSERFTDAFATASDPSAFLSKGIHAGVYVERRFMVDDLNVLRGAIAAAGLHSSAAISLDAIKAGAYTETHATLQYAKYLGAVSMSAQFRLSSYKLRGYSTDAVMSVGISSTWKLTDRVFSYIVLNNPPFARIRSRIAEGETAEYQFGLGGEASDRVYIGVGAVKREMVPLIVTAIIHYKIGGQYLLRAGWHSSGPQPFIALNWTYRRIRFAISVSWHPVLSASPAFMVQYDDAVKSASE